MSITAMNSFKHTINSFKGYDTVNQEQERLQYRKETAKRMAIISVSFILLVIIILVAVCGMRVGKNPTRSTSGRTTNMLDAMKAVCSMTTYPDLCMSSLASKAQPGTTDPELLFITSLAVSYTELSNVSGVPSALAATISDLRIAKALNDCQGLIADSVDQLNISLLATAQQRTILTKAKVNDLRAWLSAALTNIATCLDGLDDTEFRERMELTLRNSSQLTSNSLAIITYIDSILQKFKLPLHRRLLGLPHRTSSYNFMGLVHGKRVTAQGQVHQDDVHHQQGDSERHTSGLAKMIRDN